MCLLLLFFFCILLRILWPRILSPCTLFLLFSLVVVIVVSAAIDHNIDNILGNRASIQVHGRHAEIGARIQMQMTTTRRIIIIIVAVVVVIIIRMQPSFKNSRRE